VSFRKKNRSGNEYAVNAVLIASYLNISAIITEFQPFLCGYYPILPGIMQVFFIKIGNFEVDGNDNRVDKTEPIERY